MPKPCVTRKRTAMHCTLLPNRTKKPALYLRAAVVMLVAGWLALPSHDARAEPREDAFVFEKPAEEEVELPLIVRSKEDKCEEYAELTDSNPFFCTRYMNERLVEILLLSARTPEPPAGPRRRVGR
ncbi:MAG: hypothetical protein ACYTF6_13470 [Planctomycetota bacterium]|jgi:hypothetical protein